MYINFLLASVDLDSVLQHKRLAAMLGLVGGIFIVIIVVSLPLSKVLRATVVILEDSTRES